MTAVEQLHANEDVIIDWNGPMEAKALPELFKTVTFDGVDPKNPPTLNRLANKPAFCPEAKAGHYISKKMLKAVLTAEGLDQPLMVKGHKGCGKTSGLMQIASRAHRPVVRVQCGPSMDYERLFGRLDYDGKSVVFVPGIFTLGWMNGMWIILDEVDKLRPDVSIEMNAVLEGEPLTLFDQRGHLNEKMIPRHPNTRIFATTNTGGIVDPNGLYMTGRQQDRAYLDRFMVVTEEYMPAEEEVKVLQKAVPNMKATRLEAMVEFANMIRDAFVANELGDTLSTRMLEQWAKWSLSYGDLIEPLNMAFMNKLDEASKQRAWEVFKDTKAFASQSS